MPTGYTAALCEGEQSFESFVWTCARAMGAMIMQRDDSLGVARIEPEKPSAFYAESLAQDRAELLRLSSLTAAEAIEEARQKHAETEAEYLRSFAEARVVAQRLMAMRESVAAWSAPSKDHEGLKRFMLEQLDTTIEHDGRSYAPAPERESGEGYRRRRIRSLERSIATSEEYREKEERAVASRNAWVAALLASVPHPATAGAPS